MTNDANVLFPTILDLVLLLVPQVQLKLIDRRRIARQGPELLHAKVGHANGFGQSVARTRLHAVAACQRVNEKAIHLFRLQLP